MNSPVTSGKLGPTNKATNMVEEARLTQVADTRLEPGEIRLIAPAKVNLFLNIGKKRSDDYHSAVSIMHALMLHDVIRMKCEPAESPGLSLDVRIIAREGLAPFDIPVEENIATRAARLLAQLLGRKQDEHMRIIIEKHIPAQAGLGGGSSDAAAVLVGAASLWGLPTNSPLVEEAARKLGADVAFFLEGGCACYTGVGDVLHHSLSPRSDALVLIKPEGGVSTKEAYQAFDECPQQLAEEDCQKAFAAQKASEVPLANNLVCASELLLPALAEVRKWICQQQDGVVDALMSGSGSAIFVICSDFAAACRLQAQARLQGWWARTTTFGPARAAVVEGILDLQKQAGEEKKV